MKPAFSPLALSALSALATLGTTAYSQTVVETRIFDQERFDTGAGAAATWFPVWYLGMPQNEMDGQVVSVDIDLEVDWNIHMRMVNRSPVSTVFAYSPPISFSPRYGDCTVYSQLFGFSSQTGPVAPNAVDEISLQMSTPFQWSGSSFNVNCGNNVWPWKGLNLWHGTVSNPQPFTYAGGNPVPRDWVRILGYEAVVDGSMRVEWTPDPLPTVSICPGNHTGQATLSAGGDYDNLWLMQSGAPQTFNLLLLGTSATSVVPSNGLCIGAGGGGIQRLIDSLSLGGEPYRLPYHPMFAGTTQYFQAWFRTGGGVSQTGECIGVAFP